MTEWIKKDDLMGDAKSSLIKISGTLKTLDTIIKTIDNINTTISTIVNTISTLSSVPAVDPNVIALQTLQKSIKTWVNDFASQGAYCLPIFPSDLIGGLESIKGGVLGFKQRITDSLYDVYDDNRPVFGNDNYIAAIVVMYDTGVVSDIVSAVTNLLKIFDVFKLQYNISIQTAALQDVKFVAADKKIQIQWSTNQNGLQPDSYQVYRIKQTDAFQLALSTGSSAEKPNLADMTKLTVFPVLPLFFPMIFEDANVENDIAYIYAIVPYFISLQQEIVYVGPVVPTATKFSQTTVSIACSNLGCKKTSTGLTHFCQRNNPAFNKPENANASECLVGKNVCSEYTNKQCKYDSGTRCTSLGYSISKSRTYDKTGEAQQIANSILYVSQFCKNGSNAQICDGYVESKIYFDGTPPNWFSVTPKALLPKELSPIIDWLSSFVDSMVSTTQKADTAVKIFGNEIANAASSLKDTITSLRDMVASVNDIFSVPVPTMYVMRMSTTLGGVNKFINTLNAATHGPKPNANTYTAGFVLLYGAKENASVDAFYGFFSKIF